MLAQWCEEHDMMSSSALLSRVYEEDSYAGAKSGVKSVTTSKQERMMGALNKRINIGGAWSIKEGPKQLLYSDSLGITTGGSLLSGTFIPTICSQISCEHELKQYLFMQFYILDKGSSVS